MAAVPEAADDGGHDRADDGKGGRGPGQQAGSASLVGEHDEHHRREEPRRAGEPPSCLESPPRREDGAPAHVPSVTQQRAIRVGSGVSPDAAGFTMCRARNAVSRWQRAADPGGGCRARGRHRVADGAPPARGPGWTRDRRVGPPLAGYRHGGPHRPSDPRGGQPRQAPAPPRRGRLDPPLAPADGGPVAGRGDAGADARAGGATRSCAPSSPPPDWTALGLRLGMLDLVATAREGDARRTPRARRARSRLGRRAAPSTTSPGAACPDRRRRCSTSATSLGVGTMWCAEALFLAGAARGASPTRLDAVARRAVVEPRAPPHRQRPATCGPVDDRLASAEARRRTSTRRSGRPCRRCGATVRVAPIGEPTRERTMFYCPGCQGGLGPDRRRTAPTAAGVRVEAGWSGGRPSPLPPLKPPFPIE